MHSFAHQICLQYFVAFLKAEVLKQFIKLTQQRPALKKSSKNQHDVTDFQIQRCGVVFKKWTSYKLPNPHHNPNPQTVLHMPETANGGNVPMVSWPSMAWTTCF